MRLPKILSAIAVVAILLVTSAVGDAAPKAGNYVEGVDWTNKVITVTGEGIVPKDAVNRTQARGLAVQAAKADAYRKLGELVNGVHVDGETTVEKMVTTKDVIRMRVSATIKGAKIVSENFLSDGGYRIVMQVPLFGVTDSLAGAIFEKNAKTEPFPEPVYEVAPSQYSPTISGTYAAPSTPYRSPLSRMSVPSLDTLIMQKLEANAYTVTTPVVETVQAAYDAPRQMIRKSVEEYASAAQGDYTGLIVDCRGLGLQPVMSPVIENVNGTKIYGHKNLNIDKVIALGMADYAVDDEGLARAGEKPIIVKAVAVKNFNSNPVLNIPDSNRVLIENHATKFLSDLKVVFLFDY